MTYLFLGTKDRPKRMLVSIYSDSETTCTLRIRMPLIIDEGREEGNSKSLIWSDSYEETGKDPLSLVTSTQYHGDDFTHAKGGDECLVITVFLDIKKTMVWSIKIGTLPYGDDFSHDEKERYGHYSKLCNRLCALFAEKHSIDVVRTGAYVLFTPFAKHYPAWINMLQINRYCCERAMIPIPQNIKKNIYNVLEIGADIRKKSRKEQRKVDSDVESAREALIRAIGNS